MLPQCYRKAQGLFMMALASPNLGYSLPPTLDVLLKAERTSVSLERCFCSPGFVKSRPSVRETTHIRDGLERAANGSCFHVHPQETGGSASRLGSSLFPAEPTPVCARPLGLPLERRWCPGHQDSIQITVALLGPFIVCLLRAGDTERHCEHLAQAAGWWPCLWPLSSCSWCIGFSILGLT